MTDETFVLQNGQHKGKRITRVPVSYLRWMVGANHTDAAEALKELQRRGTVFPKVEVTHHAIDRASLRCRDLWLATRRRNEGISAWLHRAALGALKNYNPTGQDWRVYYAGMKFQFKRASCDSAWPVLLTVNRHGGKYAALEKAKSVLSQR
jgi:hypothetical protein